MDLHGKLLSEGLVRRGHSVTIISTRHPDGIEYQKQKGVEIYYLKNIACGSRRKGWAEKSVDRFLELHKVKPFDIIWSQSFDAFGLTKLCKKAFSLPLILTLHGSIQQEYVTFKRNFFQLLKNPVNFFKSLGGLLFSYYVAQKPLLSYCDRIISVSNQVSEDVEKWFGQKVSQKCIEISNGIDLTQFRPDSALRLRVRDHYGIKESDILLLSLGRITQEKGHHIAIEALAMVKPEIPDLKLMIAGGGSYLDQLKKLAEVSGVFDSVIFTGLVEGSDTPKLYNGADIFLMPTLTIEGLPFVILEAMACGKPVIASEIGGNKEIIENNYNGILVDYGISPAIAEKIKFLIHNHNEKKNLSLAARKTIVDKFSIDVMIDRTLELMKSL